MIRGAVVVVACVVGAWLGAVQLASSAAYGDLAARPSLPAVLHERWPRLWRPLLGGARARAAAAIHQGDLGEAERLLARLGDDSESEDLRGRLAEARGDRDAAVAAYVRARDVVRAQGLIDAVAVREPVRALGAQQRLVAMLGDDPNAGEVAGEAWWRLGQLQAAAGYADSARRAAYWRDAEASYEHALQYAPNEETYLLAAGYQSLANGDVAASQRFYARAADVVPNSADAFGGLAWSAAKSGDCAAARRNLERARVLRGTAGARSESAAGGAATAAGGAATATGGEGGAALIVRDPLDDPVGGPALRRCMT